MYKLIFKPSFVQSLSALSLSKPEVVIRKLHQVFGKIDELDHRQVVLAYQTLETTARACQVTDCPVVQEIKSAILARMQYLGQHAPSAGNGWNWACRIRTWYQNVSGLPKEAFSD